MQFCSGFKQRIFYSLLLAASVTSASPAGAEELPPGYHRMPDGRIMANNPATAIAPPGYFLRSNGVLVKLEESAPAVSQPATVLVDEFETPPGFHRMPDGRLMANNPASAIAPPGYYMRANGVLVKLEQGAEPPPPARVIAQDVPAGFHRMPDGRIMANNPATAVAPAGYHLMPDGTLMSSVGGGGGDSGAHQHHHGSHGKGMWMFEYRYSYMNMADMLDTTKIVTAKDVLNSYGYMMSPTDMSMQMHMLMGMYGITNNLTVMAMVHFMANEMGMTTNNGSATSTGVDSTMTSAGFGDSVVSLLYSTPFDVVIGMGVGIPSGSIYESGKMVMDATNIQDTYLPYGMQLGSGSFDVRPSLKYSRRFGDFTLGTGFEYIYRVHDNNAGYRLGNKGELNAFTEWHVSRYFSLLARGTFSDIEKIKGKHIYINTTMSHNMMDMPGSPAADPSLYGGMRLDGTLGFKVNTADRMWGARAELTLPVYQNLWGPQMRTTWIATFALEAMF
ncbi:MAG: hypothetical protein OEZ43_19800 [Gammaproteobacteria bacterium]|nr:hypothetical protein [Gammaproteobacteria bacterium]